MPKTFRAFAFLPLSSLACGFAIGALPFETRASPAPAAQLVHIGNFTFNQPVLTVRRGTSVTWINDDDIPHTVVAKNLTFKSKVLDSGERFTFTFAKAGEFDYFCSIHPHMTGKVIVKA